MANKTKKQAQVDSCPEGKELIKGRCYVPCKDGQVRNPKNNRCRNAAAKTLNPTSSSTARRASSPYDAFAVSLAGVGNDAPSIDDISQRLKLVDERVASYLIENYEKIDIRDPKVLARYMRAYLLVNFTIGGFDAFSFSDKTREEANEFLQIMKRVEKNTDRYTVSEKLVRIIMRIMFGIYV
jgi:hypothetical protein